MIRYRGVALALAATLVTGPGAAGAQTTRYQPSGTEHQGREVVAVVVGSSKCGASTWAKFIEVVDPMLRALQVQARSRGFGFAAIGVGVDEPADSGIAYLRRVADFDEILAGRTWLNTGLSHYLAPESVPQPATPSLLIVERQYSDGLHSPRSIRARRLFFAVGADSIMAFAQRGAPIGELLGK